MVPHMTRPPIRREQTSEIAKLYVVISESACVCVLAGLSAMIGKKVLMINFPQLGTNSAGAILKLVFREVRKAFFPHSPPFPSLLVRGGLPPR